MTTTQELVERLREGLPYVVSATVWAESDALKAEAASRIEEMDAEIKRLREAIIIYFTQPSSPRHDEAFNTLAIFATEARAALEHDKGDGL